MAAEQLRGRAVVGAGWQGPTCPCPPPPVPSAGPELLVVPPARELHTGASWSYAAERWDSLPGARLLPEKFSLRENVKPSTSRTKPQKPYGAVPLVKVKTSRSQSVNDRKQTWDYSHH